MVSFVVIFGAGIDLAPGQEAIEGGAGAVIGGAERLAAPEVIGGPTTAAFGDCGSPSEPVIGEGTDMAGGDFGDAEQPVLGIPGIVAHPVGEHVAVGIVAVGPPGAAGGGERADVVHRTWIGRGPVVAGGQLPRFAQDEASIVQPVALG